MFSMGFFISMKMSTNIVLGNVSIWFPEVGDRTGRKMQTHSACMSLRWEVEECWVHVRTLLRGCDSVN